MTIRRVVLWLAALATAFSAFAAEQPVRKWRPTTLAEVPGASRGDAAQDAPAPAAGQRVEIDPATGAIVETPRLVADPQRLPEEEPPASLDFSLRSTPEGFLYVDTRGYVETMTATIAPDGTTHVDCGALLHGHAHEAAGAAPPGPADQDTDASGRPQ